MTQSRLLFLALAPIFFVGCSGGGGGGGTPPVTPMPPAQPSSLVAVSNTPTTVSLTWVDAATTETGYVIDRAEGAGTFTTIANEGIDATSYEDTGLAPATTYSYRLAAVNDAGQSEFTATATVTTQPLPPTQLVLSAVPSAVNPLEAFDVTVEVRDASGQLTTTANDQVSLSVNSLPDLLWHSSGDLGNRLTELVEVTTAPTVVASLANSQTGVTYGGEWDSGLGLIRATNYDRAFLISNPTTGDEARYRNTGQVLSSFGQGPLVFDAAGQLHLGNNQSDQHEIVDVLTGAGSAAPAFSLAGGPMTGVFGLATQPTTGTVYGVIGQSAPNPRLLATVDLASGQCMPVGPLGSGGGDDRFAGISFGPDGTLYGLTDGLAVPTTTLFRIDPADATTMQVGPLTQAGGTQPPTPNLAINGLVRVPRLLGGPATAQAVNGVATFTNVYFNQVGNGYRLTASASGLSTAESSIIDVSGMVTPTTTVGFATTSSSITENVPSGQASISLTVSQPVTHVLPVMIVVADSSTATLSDDATVAGAFQVVIPPGATSVEIVVPIVNDPDVEGPETLQFVIQSANLAIGFPNSTHTLTINSDE